MSLIDPRQPVEIEYRIGGEPDPPYGGSKMRGPCRKSRWYNLRCLYDQIAMDVWVEIPFAERWVAESASSVLTGYAQRFDDHICQTAVRNNADGGASVWFRKVTAFPTALDALGGFCPTQ